MSIRGNEESSIKENKKKRPRGFEDFANDVDDSISNIWSNLPDNILLDEILTRVPPFTIFRFRRVCKRWNSILQNSKFLNRHSTSSHVPCLLTLMFKNSRRPEYFLYDFDFANEYKITFDFLSLSWHRFWLVGSSGGLVCFAGLFDHGGLTTLVCNPLTKKSRLLPRMNDISGHRRELIFVADRLKQSFKVIAHGDESLPTEVYDSKTNQWSLHDTMIKPDSLELAVGYCDDSRLYMKNLSSPSGLRMYRIDTGEWETLTPDEIPSSLSDSYLVSGSGKRLFLVTRVFNCVKIWEFDYKQEVVCWDEICKMPEEYLKDLLGDVSVRSFECFGQDGFICFRSRSQGKAISFNVDKKIWSWVIGFERALRSSVNQLCFYEPRFDAFV